jgi:hypothetical protein
MAQRRIARQNELSIVERMDAYYMVGWMSLLSGDLAAAEETLRDELVLLDYAQHPTTVLASLGNLMYVLMLQGRWDEIFRLGDQAVRVWNESKVAIGPGRIGFIVGTELSRARRDVARAAPFIDALIQMTKSWPTAALFRAFAEGDRPGLVRELPALINRGTGRADLLERALSTLNDHGQRLDEPTLQALRQRTQDWRIPLIEAQISRAQGDFAAAATIFAQIGAKPYEARARIELARAQGLQPDSNAVDVLRKMGDIEYLESHDLGA